MLTFSSCQDCALRCSCCHSYALMLTRALRTLARLIVPLSPKMGKQLPPVLLLMSAISFRFWWLSERDSRSAVAKLAWLFQIHFLSSPRFFTYYFLLSCLSLIHRMTYHCCLGFAPLVRSSAITGSEHRSSFYLVFVFLLFLTYTFQNHHFPGLSY